MARKSKIDLSELIAEPNFRPRAWQSAAPPTNAAGKFKQPISSSPDLTRVIGLPLRERPEPGSARAKALIAMITARFLRDPQPVVCKCASVNRTCITELRLAQAWALYEISSVGGCLGAIGVGHGKTGLNLLAPLAMKNCKSAVVLLPPGLVEQTVNEHFLFKQHFRVPRLKVHGRHEGLYDSPTDNSILLHVYPYSLLSRPESSDFLRLIDPDLIIADECDKLRHPNTATTSRFLRRLKEEPRTKFFGWTGSLSDDSITNYAHLSAAALREGSPLPLEPQVVNEWAKAIDPSDWPAPAGALLKLCHEGEHVHAGFHRRLVGTPGFVATTEPSVDLELVLKERVAPEVPFAVSQLINEVVETWTRPDGEEFMDSSSYLYSRCLVELACGFWQKWIFPRGEPIELIEEWLAARKLWAREVRNKLRDRREHLDSPHLCQLAAMRAWGDAENEHGKPVWKAASWPRWRKVKGKVEPKTKAVWVDDFLARDSAAWALENQGIVWYQHVAFGRMVSKISGLPWFGGGKEALNELRAEKGNRSIVCSISAHGRGRDGLQFLFNDQLIANPSSSGSRWEQLLGRLYRNGQKSPTVTARFYRHTKELRKHVDLALRKALYVESTLGTPQKLNKGFLD